MEWYYAIDGKQFGPVPDSEFQNLVQSGTIKSETLVWNKDMDQWKPYGSLPVKLSLAKSSTYQCLECKNQFSKDAMISYKGSWICAACKPAFFQRLQEGGSHSPGLTFSGFWRRFAAYFLDGLILGAFVWGAILIYVLVILKADILTAFQPTGTEAIIINLIQLASFFLQVGYYTWFVGRFGATPGKMALGIKVVSGVGEPISYLRALARFFSTILSGCTCLIGYLMFFFDEEKRTLHDRICDTRVVLKS